LLFVFLPAVSRWLRAGSTRVNPVRVGASLDGPMGDGIRETERVELSERKRNQFMTRFVYDTATRPANGGGGGRLDPLTLLALIAAGATRRICLEVFMFARELAAHA
jgi:hypothetical protein